MRRRAVLCVVLGVSAGAVSPALAQNSANSNVPVNGNVISPLTLTVVRNMTMPTVVRPATSVASPTAVSLACGTTDSTNLVTYSNFGNPFAHGTAAAPNPVALSKNASVFASGATGICAELTVTGQSGYFYMVGISGLTGGAPGVSISQIRCNAGPDRAENGDSVQFTGSSSTIRCGLRTSVTNASAPGTYTGSFTYTVTYD